MIEMAILDEMHSAKAWSEVDSAGELRASRST